MTFYVYVQSFYDAEEWRLVTLTQSEAAAKEWEQNPRFHAKRLSVSPTVTEIRLYPRI